MIAAIYARKSTDQNGVADAQKSVTRQVERAKEYAAEKGWTVVEAHIYQDDGVSGAEFKTRPGYVRLTNALTSRAPFDVLVVSELSRLGREQVETGYALKQLSQAGVRVYSYLEDREVLVETPTDKFLMFAVSLAAEIEREKASQRTHDAMSRKARTGQVTGGQCFGYDNVPITVRDAAGQERRSHVERVVNEPEAVVVRRIFALCAQGYGLTRIAKELNEEGVRSPRAQQGRPRGWAPSSLRAVLYRDLYHGELVWNRTKKRDKWGQSKRSSRPEGEWVRQAVPALRIVSAEAWQAAHDRLAGSRSRYLRQKDGRVMGRPPATGAKYLLAGFLTCGCCGSSLEARSRSHGKRRAVFYGCAAYHRRGKSICANSLTVPMAVTDDAVLSVVEDAILRSEVVEAAVERAVEQLTATTVVSRRPTLEADLAALESELTRLTGAIATGGELPALLDAVQDRERRREALRRELELLGASEPVVLDRAALRKNLESRLGDWRGLLRRHTEQGQQILRRLLVGRLTFTPTEDETGRYYAFHGTGTLTKLVGGLVPHNVASPTGTARVVSVLLRRAA